MKLFQWISPLCLLLLVSCAGDANQNPIVGTWQLDPDSLRAGGEARGMSSTLTFGADGTYLASTQYQGKEPEEFKGYYQAQNGTVKIDVGGQQTDLLYNVQGSSLTLRDESEPSPVTYIKK